MMNWRLHFGCSAWRILRGAARAVGSPASALRAVRGGSWNNRSGNCRLGYRNRNSPDNRNNNLGFRVVCCHIPGPGAGTRTAGRQRQQCVPVTAGLPSRRALEWRGWVPSRCKPGRILKRAAPRVPGTPVRPTCHGTPALAVSGSGHRFAPAADQPPQFSGEPARVLELPVAQPVPLPGQVQVLAQLVEQDVGIAQGCSPRQRRQVARRHQRVVDLHRQLGDVAADQVPLLAWPLLHMRQQPGQQVAGARVHHHAVARRQP